MQRETSREFTGTRVETAEACGPQEYETAGTISRDTLFPNPTYNVQTTTRSRQDCLNMTTGVRPTYENVTRSCRVTFVIDKGGIVRAWSFKGDLC